MKDVYDRLDDLVALWQKDQKEVNLQQFEQEMEQDPSVFALVKQYETAQEDYNTVLKFCSNDTEAIEKAQKTLYETKNRLENHPKVKKYQTYFVKQNEPLRYIEFGLKALLSTKEDKQC